MILSELFRCPRTGRKLLQDEASAYSADGTHRYEIVDGVPDFYIDGGGAAGVDDEANCKWLDADTVEGRDLYYERCREWEGMSFCLEQISRLSYNKCRILEVGAGTGHFSRWICDVCQPGTQLYTFDYSWPCIRKTQTQLSNCTDAYTFRANARGPMPFAAESFDIILQRLAPLIKKARTSALRCSASSTCSNPKATTYSPVGKTITARRAATTPIMVLKAPSSTAGSITIILQSGNLSAAP